MLTSQVVLKVTDKETIKQDPSLLNRVLELTNGRDLTTERGRGSGMRSMMTFSRHQSFCVLAYKDDKIIGWTLVEHIKGVSCQIACYVAHEHRCQGIGSMLVNKSREHAAGLPFHCDPWNEAGRRLYEKARVRVQPWTW